MKLITWHDVAKRETHIDIVLPDNWRHTVRIDDFDRAVLNTPKGEGAWFVANSLQDLQLIAMRIAQSESPTP